MKRYSPTSGRSSVREKALSRLRFPLSVHIDTACATDVPEMFIPRAEQMTVHERSKVLRDIQPRAKLFVACSPQPAKHKI
jgi:hypothetical protein